MDSSFRTAYSQFQWNATCWKSNRIVYHRDCHTHAWVQWNYIFIVFHIRLALAFYFHILQFWVNTEGQVTRQGPGGSCPSNKRDIFIFIQWEAHNHRRILNILKWNSDRERDMKGFLWVGEKTLSKEKQWQLLSLNYLIPLVPCNLACQRKAVRVNADEDQLKHISPPPPCRLLAQITRDTTAST